MAKPNEPIVELRSAYYRHALRPSGYQFPHGSTGMFMRVTLAVIYMYLIFFGYMTMGLPGILFVSVMFLVALLSPILYHALSERNRRQQIQDLTEVEQEA